MRCLHLPTLDGNTGVCLSPNRVTKVCLAHDEGTSTRLNIIPLVILEFPRQAFWACRLHVLCSTNEHDTDLELAARSQARDI
ncbi:hypothetical protein LTR75_015773, partial [Friedmanniomyces endolithicus]